MLVLFCLLGLTLAYEPTIDNFQLWSNEHSKTYATESERLLRSMIWLDNAIFVKSKNAENNGVTYKLNQFGDMTHTEYKQLLSPISHTDIEKVKETQELLEFPEWLGANIPDTVDWRTEGAVTPVKDQGICGSCYAFSTTGALEGACAIKSGKPIVSLSEQQIMDCSWMYGNNGCNGGMFDRAFYYIHQNGGLDTEESYPYKEEESYECKYDPKNIGGTVGDFYYVNQENEMALAVVLAIKGPVAIAINAEMRDFMFYEDGVYDNPFCDDGINHGVLAVGYGTDDASGKDYFLVKNSWGTTWGDQGYIKMRRNAGNQCGIATYASVPECEI